MDLNPLSSVLDLVSTVIGRVWPDKTEVQKEQFMLDLQKELDSSKLLSAQIDVNNSEAQNDNLFVSGWRPFIGWVCATAFAWQFVIVPMVTFLCVLFGHVIVNLPAFDTASLNYVLFGMLGLGTLRSVEKITGRAK